MENTYSYEVSKIFKEAEKIKMELKHSYVGTEHLLLSLLKLDEKIKDVFFSYSITYDIFKDELMEIVKPTNNDCLSIYTPLLKRVINNVRKDKNKITPIDLLLSLIEIGEGIALRILVEMNVDIDNIYLSLKNQDNKDKSKLEIYKLGKNLQDYDFEKVINRENEINLAIETLFRKNKNNPLLIGEPGVGKSAIVEELSRRIKVGDVPSFLENKKIISLEMGALISGTKYRGEFEEKLENIIKEVEQNKDIILFIDEIHTIVNAGGAEGAINASDILKPYLARGKIKLIGATTLNEYNKYILSDKALSRRFEVIKVLEPDEISTKDILLNIKENYEKHYNIDIDDENIDTIINLTNKYILNRYNPDKSLDLLDSVCAMKMVENNKEIKIKNLVNEIKETIKIKEEMVKLNNFDSALEYRDKELNLNKELNEIKNKKLKLTNNDIRKALYRNLNIPLLNEKLDTLEEELNEVIVGQKEAIKDIVNILKSSQEHRPISLMLTGSTGVGKTKTVKDIAKILNIPLIKLDMTEYSTEIALTRLIGVNQGYVGYNDRTMFDSLKLNPYAIILLDEIEKAHPSILNLFLQILDDGYITNARGEKIDFKNAYIFMTSNAVMQHKIGFMKNNGNFEQHFSKEFLARISKIICYKDIDEMMLKEYLNKKNIKDLEVIKNYDYKSLGFRSLDKILKEYTI
ncbi:ATP-dependent Clp protease ATP-binding subunit [bacterium]|nr:ATP-dependent Clp protease ATP-binding subunit [bacterium]MBD8924372.1 ATP-dependent Clp protease ATP-binding subunit [bacterium]